MVVQYPDVSHYQPGLSLRGAPLVFAKATQGRSYTDPAYAGFREQAKTLGIPFGAYHWLDTTDAERQAEHCFGVVGKGAPLMVDDEQPRISVAHTLAFVAAFRRFGGTVTLEYLPRWVWDASGRPDLRPLAMAGLHLVASNYNAHSGDPGGAGWQPYGGVTPEILQFTSTRSFNGQAVDFNQYPGQLGELLMLVRGIMATGDADSKAPFIDMRMEAIAGLLSAYARVWIGQPVPFVIAFKQLVGDVAEVKAGLAQISTSAATQEQVDAAMLAALRDPTVQQGIADKVVERLAARLSNG